MSILERWRRRRQGGDRLPDPAMPPQNRGSWDEAALTNVDITELVKNQIHTQTKPWQR
ncbi:MAG: hypothetical protein ACR2GX_05710 [Candidatus Dormibacteria bacterium]